MQNAIAIKAKQIIAADRAASYVAKHGGVAYFSIEKQVMDAGETVLDFAAATGREAVSMLAEVLAKADANGIFITEEKGVMRGFEEIGRTTIRSIVMHVDAGGFPVFNVR